MSNFRFYSKAKVYVDIFGFILFNKYMSETEHLKEEVEYLKTIKKEIAHIKKALEEIKKTPSFSALEKEERKKALQILNNHLAFLKNEEKRYEKKIKNK